jgi:excisionase family DNA binding protein
VDPELTVKEVADWVRLDPQTVRRWIRDGLLHADRRGRAYVIHPTSLADSLREHTVPAASGDGPQ